MKPSDSISFDSEEGGFVSFEKKDGKLIVRIGTPYARYTWDATIPAEAVEHLACLPPAEVSA